MRGGTGRRRLTVVVPRHEHSSEELLGAPVRDGHHVGAESPRRVGVGARSPRLRKRDDLVLASARAWHAVTRAAVENVVVHMLHDHAVLALELHGVADHVLGAGVDGLAERDGVALDHPVRRRRLLRARSVGGVHEAHANILFITYN